MILVSSAYCLGLSISPSVISVDNALKGGSTFREINVGNPNSVQINVSMSVRGALSYFTTLNETEFGIGPKETKTLRIGISPSKETASGSYDGEILASMSAAGGGAESAGGSKISVGVISLISVGITGDEVKRIEVLSSRVERTEYPIPARLKFRVHNQGNVNVMPHYIVEIYGMSKIAGAQGSLIKAMDGDAPLVPPNEFVNMDEPISVADLQPGDYNAHIRVYPDRMSLDGGPSYAETRTLTVLEKGSLSMGGQLMDLLLEYSELGNPVKITGEFRNNGDYGVSAHLIADIYDGDILIANLKSDEKDVAPGATESMTVYHTPQGVSRYAVKARVKFGVDTGKEKIGSRESNEITKSISFAGEDYLPYAAVGAVVAALALFLLMRGRKSAESEAKQGGEMQESRGKGRKKAGKGKNI